METCPKLPHEDDEGNVEYKWKLVRPTEERLQQLITQLHFRLGEGGNEAIYEIGVEDDGTPRGLSDDDLDCSLQTGVISPVGIFRHTPSCTTAE